MYMYLCKMFQYTDFIKTFINILALYCWCEVNGMHFFALFLKKKSKLFFFFLRGYKYTIYILPILSATKNIYSWHIHITLILLHFFFLY